MAGTAGRRLRRTQAAAVQILLDDLEHAFSYRDKTNDAHRVDFGLDTERRLGLTSRERSIRPVQNVSSQSSCRQ
jgi:hypothetical protein